MRNKIFVIKDFYFDLQRFDSAFGGGDSSEANPYQIARIEDPQRFSNNDKEEGGFNYGE